MTIKQNGGVFGRNPSFKDVEVDRLYFNATASGPEVTIASSAITISSSYVRVDTEGDASTDDLDTINGGKIGQLLILRARNSSRTVVVKDAGNLDIEGDFTMNHSRDCIVLLCIDDGGSNDFIEIARSNNNS
jgi:hypothetical protein